MPIAFACSGCANVLKVADTMGGRRGKCPKCGAVNLVPPAGQIQAAAPPPRPAAKTAARKVKPVEPEVLDPEVVEEEEEEAAPRPRKRARKPVEEEEVEAEEAEEVEDRPKKRKKKKKKNKRGAPILLLSLIGGGFALLFLCAGVGGLAWWMFFSGGISDELKYMPNNCQFVASVRMDQLIQSDVFKDLRKEVPEIDKGMGQDMNKEMGLPSDDIERMVAGGSGAKDVIVVIRTKKAVDAKDIRSKIKNGRYTETKVGKYAMQEAQDGGSPTFCVVDKKMIVLGEKEAVRAVLNRDKKPEFSKNLQAAMNKTDFSKTIAVAADFKARSSGGGGVPLLGANADMLGGLDKADGLALQVKVGSDVRIDMTLLCQDAKSADDIKKVIDGFLTMGRTNKQMPKEVGDLLDIPLKVDGNNVTASKSFKVTPLIQAYKQQKGKF